MNPIRQAAPPRVLLVEDDAGHAATITSTLVDLGLGVDVVADGPTALDAAKSSPPALIILRVELPRPGGYAICNKLKKSQDLKSIPLLLVSSEADPEIFVQHRKLKTRADDYLIMPFAPEVLVAKVCSLVGIEPPPAGAASPQPPRPRAGTRREEEGTEPSVEVLLPSADSPPKDEVRRRGGTGRRKHPPLPETFVHPTATVDDGAKIGARTRIWHYCHVMGGAQIGERCILGQNVFVGSRAVIGNGVKIQNNVSVYDAVTLEDEVFCGPSMVFTNVIVPRAFIERKDEYRPTLVCRGATIGANATILCGHTIGAYALVGAGAVVTKDVPPHALFLGVPAKQAGWVCRCGLALLGGEGRLECRGCGQRYRLEEGSLREVAAKAAR